jgi:hypothetical protein
MCFTEAYKGHYQRPGPYINAEVSGGGYPAGFRGIKRSSGLLIISRKRTSEPDEGDSFLHCYTAADWIVAMFETLVPSLRKLRSPTVALLSLCSLKTSILCYPGDCFPESCLLSSCRGPAQSHRNCRSVRKQRCRPLGLFAPGSGTGEVQIYGHDSYPWALTVPTPTNGPTVIYQHTSTHCISSRVQPPYTISEFQGGSFDPWGGSSSRSVPYC